MSGFLYFLPSNTQGNLTDIGLPHIADASCSVTSILGEGPSGMAGVIYAPKDANGARNGQYKPDIQTWQDCGLFWLGYDTDSPPVLADLKRPEIIDGHRVMLENQFDVIVPLVRRFPNGTNLPENLLIGVDGTLITQALPRFAWLSGKVENLLFEKMVVEGLPIPFADLFPLIVEALSINYRLGKYEVSALKLITTTNAVKIAEALVDMPTIIEFMQAEERMPKKKPLDEEITLLGNQA